MKILHLFFNRFTGYIALFAASYAVTVSSGFAEWLDPLFGLAIGMLSFRYVSKWLAVIPWAYAAVQLAFLFQLSSGGTVAAILLMSCGYLMLLNPPASPLAGLSRFGDVHIQPPEMGDIRIERGIGDVRIDFSTAFLQSGEHQITIDRLVGNVVIYLPYGLEVAADIKVMIGKQEVLGQNPPRFPRHLRLETERYADVSTKLCIVISSGIGDVNVRYL